MKKVFFVASVIISGLMAGSAQAATANVQILFNVNASTSACTVTPSAASFNLPNGMATQGIQDWMKVAGFTQPLRSGGQGLIAGSVYDQNVAIACDQPNTTITSILVVPAAANSTGGGGLGYLLDSAGNKLAGGHVSTSAELVSITSQAGAIAPLHSFQQGTPNPYTTPFMTTSSMNSAGMSTASFVWHPALYADANVAMGTPVGGAFVNPWVITVNY